MLKIVRHVNEALRKYNNTKFDIFIDIGDGIFKDKLTYMTLECIIYSLIVDYKKHVVIAGGKNEMNQEIASEGFIYSPIHLLKKSEKNNIDVRCKEFVTNFDKKTIYKNHYRNMIKFSEDTNEKIFSLTQYEIRTFLYSLLQNEEHSKEIAEVASELLMNAFEHTKTDCLIDIDVTKDKIKVGDAISTMYKGINIAIINFSEKLFGDSLKQKMASNIWCGIPKYEIIYKAYNNHKKLFDEQYNEKDFYNIASLQDKISGRLDNSRTGGTGLTQLIHSVEKRSDSHYCYLLSGEKVISFIPEYLKANGEYIGFNKENDFVDYKPDNTIISSCDLFMPGTAFNLNFVMKKS